jgi:hypothetical protein
MPHSFMPTCSWRVLPDDRTPRDEAERSIDCRLIFQGVCRRSSGNFPVVRTPPKDRREGTIFANASSLALAGFREKEVT